MINLIFNILIVFGDQCLSYHMDLSYHEIIFLLVYFRINKFTLRRKMNTEMFSKLNHNFNVKQDIKDIEQNIVWFDGEVCIINRYYIFLYAFCEKTYFVYYYFCNLQLNS